MFDDDDASLVARCRTEPHDPRPFETLVTRHRGFVLANCRTLTRSPDDAEDLAQEVFVKAYFALQGYAGRASFRGWLRAIKVNHCLNWLRRARGTQWTELDEEGDATVAAAVATSGPDLDVERDELRRRIVQVLDGMSDTLRVPLVLRDADGLAYEEIAAQLGISLPATKMRIKRGRETFRARWLAAGGDPVAVGAALADAGAQAGAPA